MRQLKNTVKAAAVCPDGTYEGRVSGYVASWTTEPSPGLTQTFEYTMDHGYRGLNIKATVVVANGVPTVTVR
jgi:hypothetical protein